MMTRVVVTGVGAMTALGRTCDEILARLNDDAPPFVQRSLPVMPGFAAPFWLAGAERLGDDVLPTRVNSVLKELGFREHFELVYTAYAIDQAIREAGLTYDSTSNRVGAILAFEAPGMERAVAGMFGAMAGGPVSPEAMPGLIAGLGEAFYRTQSFVATHVVGKCFQLHGFTTVVHNACSSGVHAVDLAASLIRAGRAEAMIAAGGEYFETGVRLAYFQGQKFYAETPHVKPFSRPATGFVVGEGGAALVLESMEHAQRRGARILCEVSPAAFAQQSWHQTLPNVRDRRLEGVIREAMGAAGVSAAEVDLIAGHGAATSVSDEYELSCARGVFGDGMPPVVAFKGLLGHLLGASALVDLAVLARGHATGTLPAGPLMGDHLRELPCRTTLKMATGFTGHDAAMVLRHFR